MRNQNGFTLIEIMVVVIIIGVLASLIAPRILGRIDDARIEAARADIQTLETALKLYKVDNFRYPTTEHGLVALVEKPISSDAPNWNDGGYLGKKQVRVDPWGMEYQYLSPGPDGSDYYVYSLGGDRKPGGEGVDADLNSSGM